MYILVLARSYPTEKYPLQGIFELDQAKALASKGHKVVMLALDLRSIRRWRKFGLSVFSQGNLKVYLYNFPLGAIPKFLFAFLSKRFSQYVMKKIKKREGLPDILHAHFCLYQGYYGVFLSKKYQIPLVITEHYSGLVKNYDDKNSKYFQFGYRNADGIICVSNALKDALKKHFGFDSTVIPNILELNNFEYKKKKEKDIYTFISVGNLIYRKGMDILLNAFAKLNIAETNLIIIGDGSERKKLEKLAIELNIEDKVQFCGLLNRNEIASYLHNSDCFVLASRSETFGVVYIEALATGTPIIATRCGGPSDIVSESNGLLVDVDNIDDLTNAMRMMIANKKKFSHDTIAMNAIEKYSPNTIATQVTNYFTSVLESFNV